MHYEAWIEPIELPKGIAVKFNKQLLVEFMRKLGGYLLCTTCVIELINSLGHIVSHQLQIA